MQKRVIFVVFLSLILLTSTISLAFAAEDSSEKSFNLFDKFKKGAIGIVDSFLGLFGKNVQLSPEEGYALNIVIHGFGSVISDVTIPGSILASCSRGSCTFGRYPSGVVVDLTPIDGVNGDNSPSEFVRWDNCEINTPNNGCRVYISDSDVTIDAYFGNCGDGTCDDSSEDCGSCETDCRQCDVEGCMDSTACNYNSDATIDDGSCEYDSCSDPCDIEWTCECDGTCTTTCDDATACNYGSSEDCEYDSCNNPCDGVGCGECESCVDGNCEYIGCDPCEGVTCNECEICIDGNCEYTGCDPCDGVECDDANDCTDDYCVDGNCLNEDIPGCNQCEPDCSGKECGDDGCGGSCGECDGDRVCNVDICETAPGCSDETECDDGDSCTLDSCDSSTGECSNDAITECVDDDGCCPEGCDSGDEVSADGSDQVKDNDCTPKNCEGNSPRTKDVQEIYSFNVADKIDLTNSINEKVNDFESKIVAPALQSLSKEGTCKPKEGVTANCMEYNPNTKEASISAAPEKTIPESCPKKGESANVDQIGPITGTSKVNCFRELQRITTRELAKSITKYKIKGCSGEVKLTFKDYSENKEEGTCTATPYLVYIYGDDAEPSGFLGLWRRVMLKANLQKTFECKEA